MYRLKSWQVRIIERIERAPLHLQDVRPIDRIWLAAMWHHQLVDLTDANYWIVTTRGRWIVDSGGLVH
jgi:hypothetical protein